MKPKIDWLPVIILIIVGLACLVFLGWTYYQFGLLLQEVRG